MDYNDKVKQLFQYLKEFSASGQKMITNIKNQIWYEYLSDIPTFENYVVINYRDTNNIEDAEEESSEDDDVVLSITKPNYSACPYKPSHSFSEWLNFDWRNDYKSEPSVREYFDSFQKESFYDDPNRIRDYNEWCKLRSQWAEQQRQINNVNRYFTKLYNLYTDLQNDSATIEFLCGNGILECADYPDIKHPLLLKRMRMTFEPETNRICIRDTSMHSEIYSNLLSSIGTDINSDSKLISQEGAKKMTDENQENDYHPLDRTNGYEFLKTQTHNLNPYGEFVQDEIEINKDYWDSTRDEIVISADPVFFVRKRLNGAVRAIEAIIRNMEVSNQIPLPLMEIVGNASEEDIEEDEELTDEQKLAELGGEDVDILLPLPANREQLEVARRIEKNNAVLVQGPPGTGKTHTIANLLGHFLSQGKSVLVTSDTKKALSVLKEKMPENLRSLCVSLLDDNNEDMEKSIDGIMNYISSHQSFAVKKQLDEVQQIRKETIDELSEIRKDIFNIKYQEFKPFVYDGQNYTLSEMGKYLNDHQELKDIIPGRVKRDETFPLNREELSDLYSSNNDISIEDELETNSGLPDPSKLITPAEFNELCTSLKAIHSDIVENASKLGYQTTKNIHSFEYNNQRICLQNADEYHINLFKSIIENFEFFNNSWIKKAIVDGKTEAGPAKAWQNLIDNINKTFEYSNDHYQELLTNKVELKCENNSNLLASVNEIFEVLNKKGKIGAFDKLKLKKQIIDVESNLTVNGKTPNSPEEYGVISYYCTLQQYRIITANLWDALVAKNGGQRFFDLDENEPERKAQKFVAIISRALRFYNVEKTALDSASIGAGIEPKYIYTFDQYESDENNLNNYFESIKSKGGTLVNIQNLINKYFEIYKKYDEVEKLFNAIISNSEIVRKMKTAVSSFDFARYEESYNELNRVFYKSKQINNRNISLNKLKIVAPEWANAISHRDGIHGDTKIPENIVDAWKYKQFFEIIAHYDALNFDDLQKNSLRCSKEYRKYTADLCELSAWYQLITRIEANKSLQQSLKGWEFTTKKIGKGTGKYAAKYRQQAREKMAECQNAVPVWIMTINQVFDNLNPGKNKFDVVIVDESSQSNIAALAVVYYGRKIIIVGDDKQVSPLAVGTDIVKVDNLLESYLRETIPNWNLYTTRTSLYDLAATTFKPLMLQEHFRCVPQIIGFSNSISYDNKIKPLRDQSSSDLLPAIISYNAGGKRSDARSKVNEIEADTVIALIKSCLEQKEYENKTFGVISMVGNEQTKYIRENLDIDPSVMEKHQMLFGNSSQFQGDERDVIILTMVDSNDGDGPLKLQSEGTDNSIKKRYNVAVSRAKDQLWIVHSLDKLRDLKDGDMRKKLLDYATDPDAFINKDEIMNKSESPFEMSVAQSLTTNGYRIVQQWPVGSYRIDMVAIDGNKKIAIECDGERWHNGEDKVRNDMERQTILERLGWTFIRIRGSEYYSNPIETMQHVMNQLNEYDIHPSLGESINQNGKTDLQKKVEERMREILSSKGIRSDKDIYSSTESYVASINEDLYRQKQREDRNIVSTDIVAETIEPEQLTDYAKHNTETEKVVSKNKELPYYSMRIEDHHITLPKEAKQRIISSIESMRNVKETDDFDLEVDELIHKYDIDQPIWKYEYPDLPVKFTVESKNRSDLNTVTISINIGSSWLEIGTISDLMSKKFIGNNAQYKSKSLKLCGGRCKQLVQDGNQVIFAFKTLPYYFELRGYYYDTVNTYKVNTFIQENHLLHNSDISKTMSDCQSISADTWYAIAKWGKENDSLNPWERNLAFNIGNRIYKNAGVSAKQAIQGMKVYKQAIENGFEV